ncbi:MAG: phosphate ABC transporter substrate-binding protein PstS [Candidatus Bathyarchaeota archaeon]|jgi:phosphate transport system permease protein/phosphate transport system substrate-binding protein
MNYRIVTYIETVALIAVIAGFALYAFIFTPGQPRATTLSGAGATFPAPLIQLWTEEFYELTDIQINYEGIGSGGGIRQHTEKTVDFGATDPPMKDEEWTAATGTLHVPVTIGGVAIVYNIPGIPTGLNFTGEIIADIFSQEIKKWNNQSIVDLNPGSILPDQDIIVCHRSDSSGTTKVFTSFLSAESDSWNNNFGASKVISWPEETLGGKGNPGVAALVQQNQYSIGYVELSYATENGIPHGKVQNAAGKFILPSMETLASASAAASLVLPSGDESWASVGSFFNLQNVDEPDQGYPITSFSYALIYKELNVIPGMTQEKAKALTQFLWWATHGGQYSAPSLDYVPLPTEVITHNEATLKMITFNGQQIVD